jgi:hypothetical protein
MKARATSFLAVGRWALSIAAAAAIVGGGAAQADAPARVSPTVANAPKHSRYPTFKQVPPAPKDVRSIPAWRTAVVAVQKDGQQLAQQEAAQPWTLSGTDAFAARARAEANPPPSTMSASDPATDAEVAAMRARAKEPPRKR